MVAAEMRALRPRPAMTTAGHWQAAPPGSAPAPGTYATPIAFRLGPDATRIAATLAAALRRADWVLSASVTGGYVTVTVTPDALAGLAVRITEAGPACARSTALAGLAGPPPPPPGLPPLAPWGDARRHLPPVLTARLAAAAGGRV